MSSKKKAIRQRILESAQIPEDLSRGAVLLQITGREEVYIENFRGILEYTDCGILILGKQGRILIEGRYLQIPFYTSEEMKITGQIDQNCSDMILGDLQSDRKSGIPHGSKCSRLAPTGRFKGADLLHQSHFHQLFDVLEHSRPAVADLGRQFGLGNALAGKNAAHRSNAVDFLYIAVVRSAFYHLDASPPDTKTTSEM